MPYYDSGKVKKFYFASLGIHLRWLLAFCFSDGLAFAILMQLEVQYFHEHATLTTAVTLKQSPVFDLTATVGTPSIAFGAEAGYDVTSGNFTKYTAGMSVSKPDSYASVIL